MNTHPRSDFFTPAVPVTVTVTVTHCKTELQELTNVSEQFSCNMKLRWSASMTKMKLIILFSGVWRALGLWTVGAPRSRNWLNPLHSYVNGARSIDQTHILTRWRVTTRVCCRYIERRICLRNDLSCVEWNVKQFLLTHSLTPTPSV